MKKELSRMPMKKYVHTNWCCVRFGKYEDDAGTGREWIECCSTRWIHEDNEDVDAENCKLCPLY